MGVQVYSSHRSKSRSVRGGRYWHVRTHTHTAHTHTHTHTRYRVCLDTGKVIVILCHFFFYLLTSRFLPFGCMNEWTYGCLQPLNGCLTNTHPLTLSPTQLTMRPIVSLIVCSNTWSTVVYGPRHLCTGCSRPMGGEKCVRLCGYTERIPATASGQGCQKKCWYGDGCTGKFWFGSLIKTPAVEFLNSLTHSRHSTVSYVYMYVCLCIYVCMYVCLYACVCVRSAI